MVVDGSCLDCDENSFIIFRAEDVGMIRAGTCLDTRTDGVAEKLNFDREISTHTHTHTQHVLLFLYLLVAYRDRAQLC